MPPLAIRGGGRALPHAKYGVDLSNVPSTYIEPFTAYRSWNWKEEGVTSLNGVLWTPKVAFEATCHYAADLHSMRAAAIGSVAAEFWKSKTHQVPDPGCTCGMYAGINIQHLIDINYIRRGIHGEVSLWGRLMRHTLGWRAQFAYPKFFIVPANMIPFHIDAGAGAPRGADRVRRGHLPPAGARGSRRARANPAVDTGLRIQSAGHFISGREAEEVVRRPSQDAHPRGRRPRRGVRRRRWRGNRHRERTRRRRHVLHDVQSERDLSQAGQERSVERQELAVGDDWIRVLAQTKMRDGTEERAAMIRWLKEMLLLTILLVP